MKIFVCGVWCGVLESSSVCADSGADFNVDLFKDVSATSSQGERQKDPPKQAGPNSSKKSFPILPTPILEKKTLRERRGK